MLLLYQITITIIILKNHFMVVVLGHQFQRIFTVRSLHDATQLFQNHGAAINAQNGTRFVGQHSAMQTRTSGLVFAFHRRLQDAQMFSTRVQQDRADVVAECSANG